MRLNAYENTNGSTAFQFSYDVNKNINTITNTEGIEADAETCGQTLGREIREYYEKIGVGLEGHGGDRNPQGDQQNQRI